MADRIEIGAGMTVGTGQPTEKARASRLFIAVYFCRNRPSSLVRQSRLLAHGFRLQNKGSGVLCD